MLHMQNAVVWAHVPQRFDMQHARLLSWKQLDMRKPETFKPGATTTLGLKGKGQEQRLTCGDNIYLTLSLAYYVFMYMLSFTSEVRTILESRNILAGSHNPNEG